MIVKRAGGYEVRSASGQKKLGGPYPTKTQAIRRLVQVEAHKRPTPPPKSK